jgi:hypothetical protein
LQASGQASGQAHPIPRVAVRAGLWLFTRKPVDPASKAVMMQKLKDLGYDTSALLPVVQAGCDYKFQGQDLPGMV